MNLAETPLTLQSPGLYLSIHEAALVDYASMNLRRTAERTLKADLMPWSDGVLVRKRGPFTTPWRMVLVADTPMALADSRVELNLNEPNKLPDTSWIHTGKYVGVWWEMHLNRSTWGSGDKHGANNANVKRYIDFAAKNGFGGVLVEGWNQGWDGDWIANGKHFSFTESYPDFDLPQLAAYAGERGVRLIGHNETAGALENYERQLEAAMALYQKNGVQRGQDRLREAQWFHRAHAARTAAVGHEWFAGQYRVRHELKVAEVAAAHRISIDAHEPVKDTGLRRTWPNMLSREGARGQEFNAWGRPTNPPEHLTILPFTRLLAGPMDFTPGIFDLTFGKTDLNERVQSTLATQLALYVLVYSPVHMAADLPENYEKRPDAFQFIRDVPTDWETSRTLQAEIGDYVVIARQQRGAADWYLGATTDENARKLGIPLDFLAPRQALRSADLSRRARGRLPHQSRGAGHREAARHFHGHARRGAGARRRPGGALPRTLTTCVGGVGVADPEHRQPGEDPAGRGDDEGVRRVAAADHVDQPAQHGRRQQLRDHDEDVEDAHVHAHLSRRQVVGEHGVGQGDDGRPGEAEADHRCQQPVGIADQHHRQQPGCADPQIDLVRAAHAEAPHEERQDQCGQCAEPVVRREQHAHPVGTGLVFG